MRYYLSLWPLVLSVLPCLAVKNSKRGLAFAEGDNPNDILKANQTNSVLSWQYNWGQSPPAYLSQSNIAHIPMQWGAAGVETFATKVKQSGARTILGFNEPDLASQANLDARRAAELWKQYVEPLAASGVRLGSPAVTNAPTGRPWLSSFLSACTGCHVDFLVLHWYGEGLGNFYDYLWQVHYQFPNHTLWVTEFATTSTNDAEVLNFITEAIKYLDTLDWIGAYAWFAFFRKESGSHYNLLDEHGQLNDLGKAYVLGT